MKVIQKKVLNKLYYELKTTKEEEEVKDTEVET